jgi:hypothetical protein
MADEQEAAPLLGGGLVDPGGAAGGTVPLTNLMNCPQRVDSSGAIERISARLAKVVRRSQ